MSIWPIGAAISSIIGGHLATISLRTPIFYTLFPFIVALVLLFFLIEPKYGQKKETTLSGHMFESIQDVFKNKQMIIILFGGIVAWSFGESMHFLSQIFFEYKQIPIVWYGYLGWLSFGLSSFGFYFSHDISEWFGNKTTVTVSIVFMSLLVIFSTLTAGYISVVLFVLSSFFFGLRSPILGHLWNEEVESRKRATLNSINSLVYQWGVAIVIPIVGYWSDMFSINTAFLFSGGMILFISTSLFLFLKNN